MSAGDSGIHMNALELAAAREARQEELRQLERRLLAAPANAMTAGQRARLDRERERWAQQRVVSPDLLRQRATI